MQKSHGKSQTFIDIRQRWNNPLLGFFSCLVEENQAAQGERKKIADMSAKL